MRLYSSHTQFVNMADLLDMFFKNKWNRIGVVS